MPSDTRRARSHQPAVERLTIDGQPYWHHTFPFEPSWWTDDRRAASRRRVVSDFAPKSLETLCVDLRRMISDPLRFSGWPSASADMDELAGLARRCLSLSWVATVAREHLQRRHIDMDDFECAVRSHEVRAAELLANNAWNILLDLPKPLAIAAIREAVARPDELYESEAED